MIDIQVTNYYQLTEDIKAFEIVSSMPSAYTYVGIDPGSTNIGVAVHGKTTTIFQCKLVRDKNPMFRMLNVTRMLQTCLGNYGLGPSRWAIVAIIENAAYGERFRQVELAEIRAAMAIVLHREFAYEIFMPSPLTIRKVVFGSGKIKAHEYWNIEGHKCPDALAALSCAYYGVISKS